MVTMAHAESPSVPLPGEPVRFKWGLRSVPGRVAEVYPSRPSPRVVVDIEPGEASDEPSTVSVPLDDVEPAPGANSAWARGFRFELAVADALARLGESPVRDAGGDLIVPGPDGPIAVHVTRHNAARDRSSTTAEQAAGILRRGRSARDVLVVTPADVAVIADPRVRVVRWRDEADDPALRSALVALREAAG